MDTTIVRWKEGWRTHEKLGAREEREPQHTKKQAQLHLVEVGEGKTSVTEAKEVEVGEGETSETEATRSALRLPRPCRS